MILSLIFEGLQLLLHVNFKRKNFKTLFPKKNCSCKMAAEGIYYNRKFKTMEDIKMLKQMQNASLTGMILSLFLSGCNMKSSEWQVKTESMKYPATFKVPANGSITDVQKKVRELLKNKPQRPIIVELTGGRYQLQKPLEFDDRDSGTSQAPVIYRSAPGEKVIISGGVEIKNFKQLTDPVLLARLPEESRNKVLVADLPENEVEILGNFSVRGWYKSPVHNSCREAEVFCNDLPMKISRWPKKGFRGALSKNKNSVTLDLNGRSSRWKAESDPWIMAYWRFDWAELFEPIIGWGNKTDEILRTPEIEPEFGLSPEWTRCYVLNLFSELSEPGEYFIERKQRKLYIIPPVKNGRIFISQAEQLLKIKKARHISFEGITFEHVRGTIITMENVQNIRITGCILRNAGEMALSGSGKNILVNGCDVSHTGSGGMSLTGGDRITLTNGNNVFDNNHVSHYSRRVPTYCPGLRVKGCGNRISHNLVHHGPHMAMAAEGNNHIVEYNEIHNVIQESGDAGAYYVGRDWTQRGNILRYNYLHHIKGQGKKLKNGEGDLGGMGIYLDDQICGYTVYGNLFEYCHQPVVLGGGCDNLVENNVFLNCHKAVHLDDRGLNWQKKDTLTPHWTLQVSFRSMPVNSPLWKSAYPTLSGLMNDDPGTPKRNVFRQNISAGGKWNDINISSALIKLQTIEKNIVYDNDPDWIIIQKNEFGQPQKLVFKDETELNKINFIPLPVKKMGLYYDRQRASWPFIRTVDAVSMK